MKGLILCLWEFGEREEIYSCLSVGRWREKEDGINIVFGGTIRWGYETIPINMVRKIWRQSLYH